MDPKEKTPNKKDATQEMESKLMEILEQQDQPNPELAAKQARLLKILQQTQNPERTED